MKFADNYFLRYNNNPEIFSQNPLENSDVIIVIPCYDDQMIFETLDSIENSVEEGMKIEVIVIVNSGENTSQNIIENNRSIFKELEIQSNSNKYSYNLLPAIFENIPKKIAGVGYARKTGMDEALRRYNKINKPDGIIVSLDADSLVSKNYLSEIINFFQNNPESHVCTLQFQHNFDDIVYSNEIIEACKLYEIYLRYFRLSLKLTGFPYCFHTIGSCFAVNAIAYAKSGGMSCRQGGEDFYFLHKSAQMTTVGEIKKILVFPSPRISDRVPFGTGPAVKKILNEGSYKVYNFNLFLILKDFFKYLNNLWETNEVNYEDIPEEIIKFISIDKISEIINECKKHSKQSHTFIKRLFSKFDAFFIIKFLNSFDETSKFPPLNIKDSAELLLNYYNKKIDIKNTQNIYISIFSLDLSF